MSEDIEIAFELFWAAGMRKLNKKKARQIFTRLAKKSGNPSEFASELATDIKNRLALRQFGFDSMHPTTYLNGERWEDETPAPAMPAVNYSGNVTQIGQRSTRDISLEEQLNDRSWAN